MECAMEPVGFRLVELVCWAIGLQSSLMERLIGIDIANASEDVLVQKCCLEGPRCAREAIKELSLGDLECVRTMTRPMFLSEMSHRIDRVQPAESTWIPPDQPHRRLSIGLEEIPEDVAVIGCSRA